MSCYHGKPFSLVFCSPRVWPKCYCGRFVKLGVRRACPTGDLKKDLCLFPSMESACHVVPSCLKTVVLSFCQGSSHSTLWLRGAGMRPDRQAHKRPGWQVSEAQLRTWWHRMNGLHTEALVILKQEALWFWVLVTKWMLTETYSTGAAPLTRRDQCVSEDGFLLWLELSPPPHSHQAAAVYDTHFGTRLYAAHRSEDSSGHPHLLLSPSMESWVALAASRRDRVRCPAAPVCAFSGHRPLITRVQTAEEEQVWQRSEGAVIIPESYPLHPPRSWREPGSDERRLWLGITRNFKEMKLSGKPRLDAEALSWLSVRSIGKSQNCTPASRFLRVCFSSRSSEF